MKQSYKVFKLGKQAVSGVLEAGQMGSILIVAGLVPLGGLAATESQAQPVTTNWVDWEAPETDVDEDAYLAPRAPGGYNSTTERAGLIANTTYIMGATGSLPNSTVVTLEGEVMSASCFDNISCSQWNYFDQQRVAEVNVSSIIGAGSLVSGSSTTDMIAHTGFVSGTDTTLHTLTFEDGNGDPASLDNVVMAIFSLGDADSLAELVFTNDFEIVSYELVSGAPSGAVRTATTSGYRLSGYETDAYIRFLDSGISEISWQVSQPEWWVGFNVGVSNTTTPVGRTAGTPVSVAALPSMQSVVGRDITASDDIYTDLGNTSPTNAQLNYVFDGGTLSLGADLSDNFSIKAGGGSVSVTGALTNRTLSGVLSDNGSANGSLTKVGSGTLKLTGTNTYTGATTVTAGRLEIASSGSIDGSSLTNNSQVDLYGSVDVTGAVINASTFNLVGGAITAANGFSNTGSLNVSGSGTSTIVGNVLSSGSYGRIAAGADLTITGNLENSSTASDLVTGGVNLGQMWTFNGTTLNVTEALTNNNRFFIRDNSTVSARSATNTSNGEISLQVGAVLSATNGLTNAGLLEGVGAVNGILTSSGTVAPGNSPGTLTVAGDVVFTGTNNFITELDGLTYSAAGGAGTYDRLAVTGTTATFTAAGAIAPILRGISAPANNTLDPVIGDAFRVVTTANASGVSGAFSTVTDPTSGMPTNTRFDVLYGGNYVDLVLTPDDLSTFAAAYGIQNMVNAADAFDGIRPAQGTNGTTDKDKFFNWALWPHSARNSCGLASGVWRGSRLCSLRCS